MGSDISSAATPVAVTGGLSFNAITLGGQHTCALTVDGTAYCWGDNRAGQLGHATPDSSVSAPVPVDGGHTFAAITAGGYFSCALALDGTAYCWGGNVVGNVGSGDTALTITAPTLVAGNHRFTAIASGSGTTCAIERSGQAYCWGYGQYGELGSGEIVRRQDTPVRVSGNRVYTAISVGGGHACALTVDSELFCWGSSGSGQLAARTSDRCPVPGSDTVYEIPCTTVPVAAARGHQFQAVSAGQGHTCGLEFTAAIYCWGSNGQGELGNGHMIDATSPTRVTDPVPPPD